MKKIISFLFFFFSVTYLRAILYLTMQQNVPSSLCIKEKFLVNGILDKTEKLNGWKDCHNKLFYAHGNRMAMVMVHNV